MTNFNIANMKREPSISEVEVIQYLRPDGRTRRMFVRVGEDIAKLAKDKGMILSAEELTTGQIAIYVRLPDEQEEQESCRLATNGPGDNSPTNVLIELIKSKGDL